MSSSVSQVADPHDLAVAVEEALAAAAVRLLVAGLPARLRAVICWRYGLHGNPELSTHQIARRLGLSDPSVYRLERQALEELRMGIEQSGVLAGETA